MDAGAGTPPKRCLNAFQSKRLWKIPGLSGIRCITSTEMLLGEHLRSRRHNGDILDMSKAKEIINNNNKKKNNQKIFLSIDYRKKRDQTYRI